MNSTYRLIFSCAHNAWVAAPETAKGRSKSGRTRARATTVAAVLSALALNATAMPTAGSVSVGSGSIAQSGATMTVRQTSPNLAVNWQSFGIGANETVNFVQPNASAIALNRVLGSDGSQILGKLNANGQVWLLNPNGVLFGKSAQVNVGGLVASTLNLSDADFLAGKRTFSGSVANTRGTVTNQGSLNANYVALLGEQVKNEGAVVANFGTVALAAGNKVTLDFAGDKLLHVQVDEGALNALVENKSLIQADGGTVVMTAKAKDALLDTAVNNAGIVRARTLSNQGGVIKLLGDMESGTVHVDGTLDASALNGGNGGFVETSAAHVNVADGAKITTKAAAGKSGTWLIDPVDFTIAAGSGALTISGIGADTLSTSLGSGSVSIATDASTAGNGDIFVNAPVSWSTNTLTLSAHRNIEINAPLNGSGTAGLALYYGQGATDGVIGGTAATYNVHAQVNLASTGSFSTKLGSSGTVKNYAVITDATALQGMNGHPAGNYVLGSNINASATSGWNSGAGFLPVGGSGVDFTGSFDGLGHTVSNLFINRPSTVRVGLFGMTNGASLRNVGLVGANITGSFSVGGLVGEMAGGSVINSYVDGTVRGVGSSIQPPGIAYGQHGGLIGYLQANGTVNNSHASATVSGTYNVGGLIGYLFSGAVSNSYATGAVSGSGVVGGLVGLNRGGIATSYSSGTVSAVTAVGGFVGTNSGSGIITNSYWDTGTSGQAAGFGSNTGTITNLTGLATANAYTQANYANLDFTNTWWMSDGNTRPFLRSEYSTTITNAHQLQMMLLNVSASYTLANNIDASETSAGTGLWGSAGFVQVGTAASAATKFTGRFDGQNHTISGLFINQPAATNEVGLFGFVTGSVSNVVLANPQIVGKNYVGSLVGATSGTGVISGGHITGGSVTGGSGVGGLVGSTQFGSTLADSDVTGTVTSATGDMIGGLVGYSRGAILNSHATGRVIGRGGTGGLVGQLISGSVDNCYATGAVSGASQVGGLAGYVQDSPVTNSYATGAVDGSARVGGLIGTVITTNMAKLVSHTYATGAASGGSETGGLVGYLQAGAIADSYSTGAVSGTNNLGGLVGMMESTLTTTIDRSYATGAVGGATNVGGLVGTAAGTVSNSFWDTGTTTQAAGYGSNSGTFGATGKTTAQMKSLATFSGAGWDIDAAGGTGKVWRIYEGYTYPLLRGFLTALNVTPTYDGSGTALTNVGAVTPVGAYDAGKVFTGSLYADTLTLSSTAADAYTATSTAKNLYSNQQGYDLVSTGRSIATPGSASGDIALSAPISWTNGTLAINTTGTVTDTAAINGTGSAVFDLQAGNWRQVNATLPAFAAQDFRVSGGTFVRALSGDGTAGTPYQLADIYGLQGMGTNLAAHYTLANDVNAAGTANWWAGAGFVAVGTFSNRFTGSLDGLGHTISGLFIDRPTTDFVGLFGYTNGATLSNIGLVNAAVTGQNDVGTLAGWSNSSTVISASYAEGGSSTGTGIAVGGLIGYLATGSTLVDSHASAVVNGAYFVGGLVGQSRGTVTGSHASGNVTGSGDFVGGLVGDNGYRTTTASIYNSYATGNVQGQADVGGLAGSANGPIDGSYASGDVRGVTDVGGLLGLGGGNALSNSYATGSVAGTTNVGGLVGVSKFVTIANTYATGAVTGSTNFGGLIGDNRSSVAASSFWDTQTTGQAGGVGVNSGTFGATGKTTAEMKTLATFTGAGWDIDAAAGTGKVWRIYEGNSYPLLRGFLTPLNVIANDASKTYDGVAFSGGNGVRYSWGGVPVVPNANLLGTASFGGTSQGAVNAGSYVITPSGLYSNQQGYDITHVDGTLTVDPAALTVTTSNVAKPYDGTTFAAGTAVITVGTLYGSDSLSAGSFAFTDQNAGNNKTVTVSGVTVNDGNGGGNYVVTTVGNTTSRITPVPLTVTANDAVKTYNGQAFSGGNGVGYSGFVGGETSAVLGGTLTYGGSAQGAVNAGNYVIAPAGLISGNYAISYVNGTLTVNKAPLTVTGSFNAADKTYDGRTSATMTGNALTLTGLFGSDVVTPNWIAAFADRNAGTGKTVNLLASTFGGAGSGNYSIDLATAPTATATITPALLTVTANDAVRTYNGQAFSGGNGVGYSGFVGGETSAVLGGTLTYGGSAQGAVNAGSYVIAPSGLVSGNYTLAYVGGTLTINPSVVVVSGSLTGTVRKAYDGTTTAQLAPSNFTLTGFVGGDGAVVTQTRGSYASANAGSGIVVTASLAASDYQPVGATVLSNYTLPTSLSGAIGVIDPASLTVTTANVSKTYDGTTTAAGSLVLASGTLYGSDSLAGSRFAFIDKNVGTNKRVTVSGVTVNDGNGGANYAVTTIDNTASSITAAPLTVTTSSVSKTYDGTTAANGSLVIAAGTLYGGDSLTGGRYAFADKNAGTNKAVTVSGVTVNDGNGGANYALVLADNTTSTIIPAALTVTAANAVKTYDSQAYRGGNGVTYSGFVGGETAAVLGGTLRYGGSSQGAVNVGSYVIAPAGLTSGNYAIAYADGTLTVNKALLTVSTADVVKTYDGTTTAVGSPVVVGGTLYGSDSLSGGRYAFTDADIGSRKTVTVAGITVNDGNGGGNYQLTTVNNTSSAIRPLPPTEPRTALAQALSGGTAAGLGAGDVMSTDSGMGDGDGTAKLALSQPIPGLPNFFLQQCGQHLPPTVSDCK